LAHSFVHTNIDQPPQKAYILDAFKQIRKKVEKSSEKKKHRLNFALIMIFGVAFSVFETKATPLDDLKVITTDDLKRVTSTFKDGLLQQLKEILHESRKEGLTKHHTDHLTVLSIIDALSTLRIDSLKLAEIEGTAKEFCCSVHDTELHIGKRLETFLAAHGTKVVGEQLLEGNISTVNGRQSVMQKTVAAMAGKTQQTKLTLLSSILGHDLVGLTRLDKLLAARQVIISIEDTRKSSENEVGNEDEEKEDGEGFDLSEAYSILCGNLWKVSGVRQFAAISEILDLMLRTKVKPFHPILYTTANTNRPVP
jgi:nucleolar pre-ribosomal-associated protein 2